MSHERHVGGLPERFEIVQDRLLLPVPDMDGPLERKRGYSEWPIDFGDERIHEPLVYIDDYGIAGQSYYSRPNAATGEPIPGVDPRPQLRQSTTETLTQIDRTLEDPIFTELFGGKVRVYIQDGLRALETQERLYDEIMPRLVREQNPDMTDEEVMARRNQLAGKPSTDPRHPSPHATGGAYDLTLRYTETDEGVDMGHVDGDTTRVRPDYFEKNPPTDSAEELARMHRRVFYNIMTGRAFTVPTGFHPNPTEWWHYGCGDQLTNQTYDLGAAYYSFPLE